MQPQSQPSPAARSRGRARKSKKLLTRGERNAAWIERYCRVPEGILVGKTIRLSTEQRDWLCQIYDSPTRTFILSMGRKNAKTTFAALLVLLHLVGPEAAPNGHLFSAAQSRDQAAILFGLAAKIVRMSPDLKRFVTVRDTAKQLWCEELGTLFRALSAEASTAYGLSPSFIVHDELGQVSGPRSDLFEALETASGAQANPLSVIISTQAPTPADLLSTLIDKALQEPDARVKVVLYSAPLEDPPFDEATIRKANPHFDAFMNKDEVMRQAEEAKRLPARESAFRNLILNQRVEAHNPFVARAVWIENGAQPTFDRKKKLYGGLDLSAVNDLCALVWVTEDGDVYPTFWLPGEGLLEKARNDRVPYDLWARDGLLLTTPGRSVEYEYVANYLKTFFRENTVQALAFDRWNMRFLRPWLEKAGFTAGELERFKEFGQGFVSMSPALRAVEERLLAKRYRHGNHPVLTMCASNAVVVTDPAGNRKLDKSKARGRIDGLVALAMAQGVIPDKPPPQYRMMIL
jgi:phage terminase large subunit-like protein